MRREEAPVKAPRSCPKSSLSSRVSGIAAQLIATKARLRRAEGVDRGRELFAGAAPPQEHGRIGRGHAFGFGAHGRIEAIADDRGHRPGLGLGEEQRLARAGAALEGARDEQAQQVRVDRLGDEVVGAVLMASTLSRSSRRRSCEDRQRRVEGDRGPGPRAVAPGSRQSVSTRSKRSPPRRRSAADEPVAAHST
jgi:hypothetical protein